MIPIGNNFHWAQPYQTAPPSRRSPWRCTGRPTTLLRTGGRRPESSAAQLIRSKTTSRPRYQEDFLLVHRLRELLTIDRTHSAQGDRQQ